MNLLGVKEVAKNTLLIQDGHLKIVHPLKILEKGIFDFIVASLLSLLIVIINFFAAEWKVQWSFWMSHTSLILQ